MGRQLDCIRKIPGGLQPPGVDQLHQQADQLALVDAGCFNTCGLNGRFVDEGIQRRLGDVTSGDQMIPKAPAFAGPALERIIHLLGRDEFRPNQKMPEF